MPERRHGQTTLALKECGVPLVTLTYEELRLIAEGKVREAMRIHVRGHDTLMHRLDTHPMPSSPNPTLTLSGKFCGQ
jgi:hypothetical protein